MKKNIFSVALLTMLIATSCVKELPQAALSDGSDTWIKGEPVTVTIGVSSGTTKATSTGKEDKIQSIQAFVFDESSQLECSGYINEEAVSLKCSAGTKTFAVCANASEIPEANISTLDDLGKVVTRLSDNNPDKLIMYGTLVQTVLESAIYDVHVTRLAARVVLRSFKNQVSSALIDGTVHITKIFINNAVGEAPLVPYSGFSLGTWYNSIMLEDGCPEMLYEKNLEIDVARGSTYDTPHYFYCYPNPTEVDPGDMLSLPRCSKLCVYAEVDGEKGYYAATIPSVTSNTSYEVDFTVTDVPSLNPEQGLHAHHDLISVTVSKWNEKEISNK